MHRKPFKRSIPVPNDIGDVLYSDVCGPITPLSHGGSKYFVTFTDGASRYSWVYFLKARSDVLRCFKIVEEIHTQTGYKVKSFHPDNAGEYTSTDCDNFLKSKGIIFAAGPPHTPQSNGVSERLNRTLVEKARCMMAQKKLTRNFWADAVNTANFLKNRSPCNTLNGVVPYERYTGKPPVYKNIRVFGSKCNYVITSPQAKTKAGKFGPKSAPALLVGFCPERSSYKLYDLVFKKFIYSRDVSFSDEFDVDISDVSTPKIDVSNDAPVKSPEVIYDLSSTSSSDDDVVLPTTPTTDPASDGKQKQKQGIPSKETTNLIDEANKFINCPASSTSLSRGSAKIVEALISESTYLEPPSWNAMLKSNDKDKWIEAANSEYSSLMKQKT